MNFTLAYPILLGWLSGWLVNYLSDVLPVTRNFSRPACRECQKPFSWGDYLLFGKCKSCGTRRSPRTFLSQALLTITPVLLWIFPRPGFPFILAFLLFIPKITKGHSDPKIFYRFRKGLLELIAQVGIE